MAPRRQKPQRMPLVIDADPVLPEDALPVSPAPPTMPKPGRKRKSAAQRVPPSFPTPEESSTDPRQVARRARPNRTLGEATGPLTAVRPSDHLSHPGESFAGSSTAGMRSVAEWSDPGSSMPEEYYPEDSYPEDSYPEDSYPEQSAPRLQGRTRSHAVPLSQSLAKIDMDALEENGLATKTTNKNIVPLTKKVSVMGAETIILPAAPKRSTGAIPTPIFAGKRVQPKHPVVGWALVVMAAVIVVGGLATAVGPIAGHIVKKDNFLPTGAQIALDQTGATSGGSAWDSSSGAGAALGFGGGAGPGVNAPGTAGAQVSSYTASGNFSASPGIVLVSPAPFDPWPPDDPFMQVPNYPSFRMARPADGYYYWSFGQCTWWAQYTRKDDNFMGLGDARAWASGAAYRGMRVGRLPGINSTVVFLPGAQGAGGLGHVAHVEAVYPGGWFLISEMNFYWNGGGWGRVDYRYAHTGPGVYFVY